MINFEKPELFGLLPYSPAVQQALYINSAAIQFNQEYNKSILIIDLSKDKNPDIQNFITNFTQYKDIQEQISRFKSLYLNLHDLFLDAFQITSILYAIDWEFLEHININLRFNELENTTTKALINCIRKSTQLHSICLNISYNKIDQEGLCKLTNCISGTKNCQIIHFNCVHNVIGGCLEEIYFKKNLIQLSLNFSENCLSKDGIANIAAALSNLEILEYMGLYLQNCGLTDQDLRVLVKGFVQMKELISLSLDLSWNKIACKNDAFATLFKEVPHIQSFSCFLSHNMLDEWGCREVFTFQPLKQLKNLMIDVQSNQIGVGGAQNLDLSLESLKHLASATLIFDRVTNTKVVCSLMNQLKRLLFCLIIPAYGLNDQQEVGEEGLYSYAPFISPYYKMKKFEQIASCCDPYNFFETQMFDSQKYKKSFFEYKNKPPSYDEIQEARGLNPTLVLNNIIDSYLFQILIKHISEFYLLKKQNLLNVNCQTNVFLHNEQQLHIEDWIEKISTQIFEFESTEPEYQYQITPNEFLSKYQIFYNTSLGDCSLGNLYLGRCNDTGEDLAIRFLKLIDAEYLDEDDELINILLYNCQMGNFGGTPQIFHFCQNVIIDKVNNLVTTVFLVAMELGETLFDKYSMYKSKRGKQQLIQDFLGMSEIIKNLHYRGLYHCDINPFKFMKFDGRIKLIDSGYLKQYVLANDKTRIPLLQNSKFEIGPNKYFLSHQLEYLSRIPHFRKIFERSEMQQSDVFQLGLSFLWCVSQENMEVQLRLYDFEQEKRVHLENAPIYIKKLILKMLDQKAIISAEEVYQELINM